MIFGRGEELARVDEVLEDALVGDVNPVLVVGEPGVGKTALLAVVARRAASRGFTVVRARAPEGEAEVDWALIEDLVRAQAVQLARASSEDRALLDEPRGNAGRMAASLTHLLATSAEAGPLLVVIDDLHWADDRSLAAVTLALGRLQGAPIAAIAATRPSLRDDPRLLRWERLELAPLAADAAVGMLRSVVHAPLTRNQAVRVVTALGGNPLAIRECARMLTPEQLEGTADLPDPFPMGPRLMAAWGTAVEALPARTADALLALCVVGEHRSDLLDGVLAARGRSQEDLEPAVVGGLVSRDSSGRLAPVHPLVRGAVLSQASPAVRRAMHTCTAEVCRRSGLAPALVVQHAVLGAEAPDEAVAAVVAHEAERAWRHDQVAVAARAWEAAARLTKDPRRRARLALRAAKLRISQSMTVADAGPLLELLETMELEPADRVFMEWLRFETLAPTNVPGALAANRVAIDHAVEAAPDLLPELHWCAAVEAWWVGDAEAGLWAAHGYVRWVDDPRTSKAKPRPSWAGAALLGTARLCAGDVEGALPLLAQARSQARQWRPAAPALDDLLDVLYLDDLLQLTGPEPDARLESAAQRLVDDSGENLSFVRAAQAWRARLRGDWVIARTHAEQALALAAASRSTMRQVAALTVSLELDALTGASQSTSARAGELRRLAAAIGARRQLVHPDRYQGLLALGEGRLDAAARHLQSAADSAYAGRGLHDAVLPARVDLVETLVRMGDRDEAKAIVADLQCTLAAMQEPAADAALNRCRAMVASGDETDRLLDQALGSHLLAGDAFETARTRLILGEHLRRTRRRGRARRELGRALAEFERLGAAPWVARSREELRVAGGAPAARNTGVDDSAKALAHLTAQERRVAEAVAGGLSNREAAAALFLSPRTVEFHLGNAFRKLQITGRGGLARALVTHPEGTAGGSEPR